MTTYSKPGLHALYSKQIHHGNPNKWNEPRWGLWAVCLLTMLPIKYFIFVSTSTLRRKLNTLRLNLSAWLFIILQRFTTWFLICIIIYISQYVTITQLQGILAMSHVKRSFQQHTFKSGIFAFKKLSAELQNIHLEISVLKDIWIQRAFLPIL